MNENYKSLFTPWKIANLEIKNRIVMTSMGGTSIFGWMERCKFDKEAANFLLERANHDVGLILPGIAPIKDPMLGKWLYTNKKMFRDLKVYMEEFHKTGCKLFIQLTAGFGRSFAISAPMIKIMKSPVLKVLAKPILNVDYLCASPSELPSRWDDSITCRPLTKKEINKMIYAFGETARLCKEAGVDGVEIHAVHEGYLLDQFTLKYTNKRSDEYGGSFENRYRFPVEIVKRIKEVCGADYPVSLRYSVESKTKGFDSGAMPNEDYVEVGRDMEESIKAANYLISAGYDMLNCDNGTYDAWYWAHPPVYMPEDCNLKEVAELRKHINVPVVCAGRMDPLTASLAISHGDIDAMGVARQFLADPAWVSKLLADDEKSIRPCICCHNGCFNMAHYKGVGNDQDLADAIHMSRCAINPETMQTEKYYIKKTNKPKKVAIIGGGIGGMEAARVLTLRGHKAVIFEKSDHLGGVFVKAATPEFKEKDRDLLAWYFKQMKDLNIEVNLNKEVSNVKELLGNFDEVIVATGSKPRKLHLPGFEKTIEACDYLNDKSLVKNRVVIIGGGLTGCEIAYELALAGKTPIIVEQKVDLIAQKGVCLANSSYLRDYFKLHNTEVYLESKVKEVKDDRVIIVLKDGSEKEILCDSVIASVGYIPTPIVEKETKNIHFVGDCVAIGNLRTVIWKAWDIAMKI